MSTDKIEFNDVAEATAAYQKKAEENEKLSKENDQYVSQIKTLMAKVKETENAEEKANPVFTYKNSKYRILVDGAVIDGKRVSAMEIKKNKALHKKLVEAESGIIKEEK